MQTQEIVWSSFRNRGVEVAVETTETAEWDIQSYQVPPARVESIGAAFKMAPISGRDRTAGAIRIREFDGWDVVFIVTRASDGLTVTICNINPFDPEDPTEDRLKKLGIIAMVRGATGL